MKREGLFDRLRKLLALGQSPNEHEAALASQRAAELMAQYQIKLAELNAHTEAPPTPEQGRIDGEDNGPSSRREEAWRSYLATHLAEAMGGQMWRQYGYKSYRYLMIGPPDSVSAARYLYMALSREVHLMGQREMRQRLESNAWRRAYCSGVVMRIGARLSEGRRTVMSTSTAIVLVTPMNKAIQTALSALSLKDSKQGRTKREDGITQGYRDGVNVDLSDSLTRAKLTSGNKRLKD